MCTITHRRFLKASWPEEYSLKAQVPTCEAASKLPIKELKKELDDIKVGCYGGCYKWLCMDPRCGRDQACSPVHRSTTTLLAAWNGLLIQHMMVCTTSAGCYEGPGEASR